MPEEIARHLVHYSLHLIAPLGLAYVFSRAEWRKNYFLMLLTMLVDIDHLWATPIFDPSRCSIGFHTFHTFYFFLCYLVLIIPKKTRWVGIGLSLHMCTDALDCWWAGNLPW